MCLIVKIGYRKVDCILVESICCYLLPLGRVYIWAVCLCLDHSIGSVGEIDCSDTGLG